MRTSSRLRHFDPVLAISILLGILTILLVNSRIRTYVCGMDPMTYIRAAREILTGGLSGAHLLGGGMTAPGFPLILAASISLFGPTAPYWVNPFIAVLTLPLAAAILMRLGLPPRHAGLTILTALLVILTGHALNPHYLLYPFRELPALFFTLAGIWCLLVAHDHASGGWRSFLSATAAGFFAVLTAATREPSVLGFAGVLLWCTASRKHWKIKASILSAFALPFAAAATLYLTLARNASPNSQWTYWIGQISRDSAAMLDRFATIEPRMRHFLFDELGWLWSALTLIGLWALRRNPRALLTLTVPAILLYVFYAFMEPLRRYFLSSLLFIAPIAGFGLAWLIESIANRIRSTRPAIRAIPYAAAMAILAIATFHTATSLSPVGPRVRSGQLKTFLDTIAPLADKYAKIMLTPAERMFGDAILSYTDMTIVEPPERTKPSLKQDTILTVHAANDAASFRGGYKAYRGMPTVNILKHHADIVPLTNAAGQEITIRLGDGLYDLMESRPWTNLTTRLPITAEPGRDCILWLDLGARSTNAESATSITAPELPLFRTPAITGGGLRPIFIPASAITTNSFHLEASSATPIPTAPNVIIQKDTTTPISLDADRSLSAQQWVRPEAGTDNRYAAEFDRQCAITIPVPHADEPISATIVFQFAPARKINTPDFSVLCHAGPTLATNLVINPNPRGSTWHSIHIPSVPSDAPLQLTLIAQPPLDNNSIRLLSVRIGYTTGQPLTPEPACPPPGQ